MYSSFICNACTYISKTRSSDSTYFLQSCSIIIIHFSPYTTFVSRSSDRPLIFLNHSSCLLSTHSRTSSCLRLSAMSASYPIHSIHTFNLPQIYRPHPVQLSSVTSVTFISVLLFKISEATVSQTVCTNLSSHVAVSYINKYLFVPTFACRRLQPFHLLHEWWGAKPEHVHMRLSCNLQWNVL